MKKYINTLTYFFLSIFIAFFMATCVDLEEDLSSLVTIENLNNESDIEAALAPLYRQFQTMHSNPHQRITTFGADDLTTWWAGNKAPLRVFDRFDYGNGENSDAAWLERFAWSGYWNAIYIANSLIDALKTSKAPANVIAIADGEARFIRSMCYFYMVRMYGGLPLITDGVVPTGDETRATVLETYHFIEQDFIQAANTLPSPSNVSYTRASTAAANTALASLYLTWGGWPVKDNSKYALAASTAKKVIDLGFFKLLDIHELWKLENQNSLESIFSLQYSETESIASGYGQGWNFHESRGFSDAYPELQFFYDFPDGPRKEATFRVNIPQRSVSGGVIIEKGTVPWQDSQRAHPMYKKFTLSENLTINPRPITYRAIEVFRYAEVLLIYAEAQAITGENASSIEALNQVKRRAAGLNYLTPDTSVDVTTATPNEIIDESGWELAGEYKRWFDLIRSERVEEIAAKRDIKENVKLVKQPTKAQYIAPIPISALSGSKLIQNPEGFVIK